MSNQIIAGDFKVKIKSIIFKCPVNQKNNIQKCVIKLILLCFKGEEVNYQMNNSFRE